jgi:ribonuclease HI
LDLRSTKIIHDENRKNFRVEGGKGKVAKPKFYVVWSGKQTGIFTTWDECKKQVIGVKGAKYKSFSSEHEAKEAFQLGYGSNIQTKEKGTKEKGEQLSLLAVENQSEYIKESLSVDAACSGNPGDMEYKGVYTKNGKEIFHFGPVPNGTNNIGEFIAIVHALALMKEKNSNLPVYSDSLTAISWVRKKKANTNIPRGETTEQVWNLIDRAEKWLQKNTYSNEILKWETKIWGEIKADFGRK